MSKHYGYYCETCHDKSPTWFNHGEAVLLAIQEAIPAIKTLLATELMKVHYQLQLKWMNVYDTPDPIFWLIRHEGHTIKISDEYSDWSYELAGAKYNDA